MAWISVHEQVEGMKLRNLSKAIGCSFKEALGIIVSLWLWGIKNADKDGILNGSGKKDIIETVSIGLSAGLSAEKIVECLINKQWIDEKDGVFILHDWDIWQEQWYKALNRRAYDTSRKREERRKGKSACPTDIPQDSPPNNPVLPLPLPLPTYIDNDNKKNARENADSKMTFSGNVFLSLEEHNSICLKFGSKDSAIRANHYITKLSVMKSDGYQSEDDFAEILKLIEENTSKN